MTDSLIATARLAIDSVFQQLQNKVLNVLDSCVEQRSDVNVTSLKVAAQVAQNFALQALSETARRLQRHRLTQRSHGKRAPDLPAADRFAWKGGTRSSVSSAATTLHGFSDLDICPLPAACAGSHRPSGSCRSVSSDETVVDFAVDAEAKTATGKGIGVLEKSDDRLKENLDLVGKDPAVPKETSDLAKQSSRSSSSPASLAKAFDLSPKILPSGQPWRWCEGACRARALSDSLIPKFASLQRADPGEAICSHCEVLTAEELKSAWSPSAESWEKLRVFQSLLKCHALLPIFGTDRCDATWVCFYCVNRNPYNGQAGPMRLDEICRHLQIVHPKGAPPPRKRTPRPLTIYEPWEVKEEIWEADPENHSFNP